MALDQHGMDVIKALTGRIQALSDFQMSGGMVLTVMNVLEEAYLYGRASAKHDWELRVVNDGQPTPLERFQEKGEGEWI